MIMKKIFLTLAIVSTISFTALAKPAKGGKQQRGGQFMKELNLTAEQQEQMKSLREDFQTKQKDLTKSYRDDVQKILTPEQQAKWQELRDKRMSDRSKGRHNMAHKGKGHRGAEANLDQETVQSLKNLKENYLKEKKAVEMSRIAPDAQKEKISALTKKYKEDRRELIGSSKKNSSAKANS